MPPTMPATNNPLPPEGSRCLWCSKPIYSGQLCRPCRRKCNRLSREDAKKRRQANLGLTEITDPVAYASCGWNRKTSTESSSIIMSLGRGIGALIKFLCYCLLIVGFVWLVFTHPLLAAAIILLWLGFVAVKGIIGGLVSINTNLAALVEAKKKEDDQ